jgi:mycoredoxin
MPLELYGTKSCPYTAELRSSLEFEGKAFVEYDVESDAAAMQRLASYSTASSVPLLVDDGRVIAVGYEGRSCYVAGPQ